MARGGRGRNSRDSTAAGTHKREASGSYARLAGSAAAAAARAARRCRSLWLGGLVVAGESGRQGGSGRGGGGSLLPLGLRLGRRLRVGRGTARRGIELVSGASVSSPAQAPRLHMHSHHPKLPATHVIQLQRLLPSARRHAAAALAGAHAAHAPRQPLPPPPPYLQSRGAMGEGGRRCAVGRAIGRAGRPHAAPHPHPLHPHLSLEHLSPFPPTAQGS